MGSVWFLIFSDTTLRVIGWGWAATGLTFLVLSAAIAAFVSGFHEFRRSRIKALSPDCLALAYTPTDWQRENDALEEGGDPQPCPCCDRRGFYEPREADYDRRYRACKFCGFWQDVGKQPHEIIRYECRRSDHYAADWKEPQESWACPKCSCEFNPPDAVAWPADDSSHHWHQAPRKGTQQQYRDFWEAKGGRVGRHGIP